MIDKDKYSAYIFDLDNTLYSENDYLFAAYSEIADEIEERYVRNSFEIAAFLKSIFIQEGRKNLFNKLIQEFGLPPETIEICLSILRSIKLPAKLILYENKVSLLQNLIESGKKIFVLTNGNVVQQKNKIKQLNWEGLEKKIIFYYADTVKPKPSPECILKIIKDHSLNPATILCIGNDESDKIAAAKAGVDYLDVNEMDSV